MNRSKRYYSTVSDPHLNKKGSPIGHPNSNSLPPDYVSGFSDAESTFTIYITKDNRIRKSVSNLEEKLKAKFYVHPSFAISLNIKDKDGGHPATLGGFYSF